MLIVLLILAVGQFVACPLLLWLAAKVVRIPGVGIARAYLAFAFLFSLSLEGLASFIFVDLPWPILVANSCWLIAAGVFLVKAIFRTKWLRALGCMALTIAANVVLSFGIRAVAVEAFLVPTSGMNPTILSGDRILADKFTLRFRGPRRREVIVFHPPHVPEETYIKRVAGVEGDKLEISGGDLLVNGSRAGKLIRVYPQRNMQPVQLPAVVPPGKLFMLGDNEDGSIDSRFWGFADTRQVVGLAVMIYASAVPAPTRDALPTDDRDGAKDERPGQIRWERIGKAVD